MITAAYGLALSADLSSAEGLAKSYRPWVGMRSNHVIDNFGNFTGADGSSRSISNELDRALLLALRSEADLIVVDAATARREKYRLPSSGSKLAIFSRSGDFSGIPAVAQNSDKTFTFGPFLNSGADNATQHKIEDLSNPFASFMDWTLTEGLKNVLLEAGPTLTVKAFESGTVTQSALTITGFHDEIASLASKHPFDSSAKLLSVAYACDATFSYWNH